MISSLSSKYRLNLEWAGLPRATQSCTFKSRRRQCKYFRCTTISPGTEHISSNQHLNHHSLLARRTFGLRGLFTVVTQRPLFFGEHGVNVLQSKIGGNITGTWQIERGQTDPSVSIEKDARLIVSGRCLPTTLNIHMTGNGRRAAHTHGDTRLSRPQQVTLDD